MRLTKLCLTVLFLVLPARISAYAAELVMFERAGCTWCQRWSEEIGPIYPKTAEGALAPLRHISLDAGVPAEFRFDPPVRYTPTFVLVDKGREVGRITGYMNDEAFWGLLGALLARLPRDEAGKRQPGGG